MFHDLVISANFMENVNQHNIAKTILIYLINLGCLFFVLPGIFIFKITKSETIFTSFGQLISLIPGKIGSYIRVNYYYRTMKQFPEKDLWGLERFLHIQIPKLAKGFT